MLSQIIVYRSRGEQYADEFWYDVAAPWIYNHWSIVVGMLVAFVLFILVVNARGKNRWR